MVSGGLVPKSSWKTALKLKMPVFNVPYHQKLLGEECDAYMGLADFHQYHPSKKAMHEADMVLMIGGRLDNQMNFGNPRSFPQPRGLSVSTAVMKSWNTTGRLTMCCSIPGPFWQHSKTLGYHGRTGSLSRRRTELHGWMSGSTIWTPTAEDQKQGRKMHPLQLSLDVQDVMGGDDWLVFDGGNTHFWSEIAVNMRAGAAKRSAAFCIPGITACWVSGSVSPFRQKPLIRTRTLS